MQRAQFALAGGILLASFTPALAASCAEEIAALEARLKDQATSAISSNTASKEVSLSREAEAVQARNKDVPVAAMPHAPPAGSPEAKATEGAARAGAAGDRVMQARATVNRARNLDQQGNVAGCMEALVEARRQLDE